MAREGMMAMGGENEYPDPTDDLVLEARIITPTDSVEVPIEELFGEGEETLTRKLGQIEIDLGIEEKNLKKLEIL